MKLRFLFLPLCLLLSCNQNHQVKAKAPQLTREDSLLLHPNWPPPIYPLQTKAPESKHYPELLKEKGFEKEKFELWGSQPTYYECASERYKINIWYYDSGRLAGEMVLDIPQDTTEYREFYENGHLKEAGSLAASSWGNIPVGVWKKYSEKGTEHITNYDTKYKISFARALEIAKANGKKIPANRIELITEGKKTVWRITYDVPTSSGGGDIVGIDIDTETGVVKKCPKMFYVT